MYTISQQQRGANVLDDRSLLDGFKWPIRVDLRKIETPPYL